MGRAEDLFALITDRGEPAIDEFIAEWQSEELFLDFKRSASNGAGRRLTDHDRDNLGRAISGFGNSEGGLIVWGACRARYHRRSRHRLPVGAAVHSGVHRGGPARSRE